MVIIESDLLLPDPSVVVIALLAELQSVISRPLIFEANRARGYVADVRQERFARDPRLHR
ncbi:hypothetical protein SAMN05444339_11542 [Loktanella atrilutea]|uniref:Uncharacterized protein n=1 Tax=Loktanella atrilutea TaxID=366533 RepID=A0A1M5EXC9_LOKAT|nr:hypothetical protein SAMN05444339_11542 [Loktanella atrilutea]